MSSLNYRELFADFFQYFGNAHSSKSHICIPCKDEAILEKRRASCAKGGEFLYLIRHMDPLDEKLLQATKVHLEKDDVSKYMMSHSLIPDTSDASDETQSKQSEPHMKCNTNLKVNSGKAPKSKVMRKFYDKNDGAQTKPKVNSEKAPKSKVPSAPNALNVGAKTKSKVNSENAPKSKVSSTRNVLNVGAKTRSKVNSEKAPKLRLLSTPHTSKVGTKTTLKAHSAKASNSKVPSTLYASNVQDVTKSTDNTRDGVGMSIFKAFVGPMMGKYMEGVIRDIEAVYVDLPERPKMRKIRSTSMLYEE